MLFLKLREENVIKLYFFNIINKIKILPIPLIKSFNSN